MYLKNYYNIIASKKAEVETEMREENLKGILGRFVDEKTDLLKTIQLRDLHNELTDYLYKSGTKEEFTIGFIYKTWIEDLLKNLFEDDYVNNYEAKEIISRLCSSIRYFIAHEEDKNGWLEEIFKFADKYKKIPYLRYLGSEIFVKGPEERYLFSIDAEFGDDLSNGVISENLKDIFKTKGFTISENAMVTKEKGDKRVITDGEKIYIVEKEDRKFNIYEERRAKLFVADSGDDRIFAGEDLDYDIFPILDRNLTDPDFSKPICDWYLNTISKLKDAGEINTLCLIEKEFSAVGGLAMLSQLVYELELPCVIFRAGYWDQRVKIDGAMPSPDSKICVVFDVVYSGRMLSDVTRFLRENFGAEVKAAVVFFDFEKGKANLEKADIKLFSYLRFSDVGEQIKAKLPLVKKLREIKNDIILRHNYEESERELNNLLASIS